jgi:Domain of unknown function (DUF6457)
MWGAGAVRGRLEGNVGTSRFSDSDQAVQMTRQEWIAEFARRLDVQPPTEDEVTELLALAAEAAHSSERTAAPIACWMAGGSARALSEVLELSREIG